MTEQIPTAVYIAGLLGLGISAQWFAWRLRLPAIVLLLAFGFAVGLLLGSPEEVIDEKLLFPLVSLAVGVILFEGGLSLQFREIRQTGTVVIRLVTIGLLLTWIMTATIAHWILGFSLELSTLMGALLTVSGPTVIVPLLRHVRPARRIGSVIKWEGIINDPIGAVLAALVFEVVAHSRDGEFAAHALRNLGLAVLVGVVFGTFGAWVLIQLMRRFWIPDFLQNPVILSLVLVLFAVSNQLIGESGLLTVTLMGVLLANQRSVTIQHVVEFKENLRTLLISALFIVLAANVEITSEQFNAIGWQTLLFVALLILIVRPLAVFIATLGCELSWQERLLLMWIHPRGIVAAAVASLLAIELRDTSAVEGSQFVFATFAVIVGTVTVYGLTVGPLSRWLGLSRPLPQGILFAGASPWVRDLALAVQSAGFETLLVDTNPQKIAAARMAGIPVCLASIGSEFVRNEIDFGNIGRLLAVTPNDEINTLATMEFAEHFDRAEVYQLPLRESSNSRYERIPPHRRGRILFSKESTFEKLERRYHLGERFKVTSLTEDFSYDDFLARYGKSALVLMVVDEQGKLSIRTAESTTKPKPGQTLIAMVEPEDA